jgi:hypothetical protein
MRTTWLAIAVAAGVLAGCGSAGGGGGGPVPVAPGGGPTCSAVRLTNYDASARGWCEFDRTLPILPSFVRSGMTLAIAEPWDGGSYGGAAGEACGECWEISSISGTRIVMVHDLCPVEGNPLCAGGFFHFDLASEAAAALLTQGLYAASTRRVACPVTGTAYLEILDRNDWYLRFQVVNQRVPVRQVDYRAASGGAWRPVTRSGGAWDIPSGSNDVLGPRAPGGVFRITSAQGQVLEMPNVLGYGVGKGAIFDLGAQLTDLSPATGPACVFEPPADVYVDGYGGIDQVRWRMNPWGPSASETMAGCASGSCIRVDGLAPWNGFHVYYVQPFPTSTFATLSLAVRAASGSGSITVAPGLGGTTCSTTTVTPGTSWSTVEIDVASKCTALTSLDTITVQAVSGSGMTLLLDDVRFGK